MRSLKSKNTFKTPFSQADERIRLRLSSPCPTLRSKHVRSADLSPLHLGGVQTVTPKTKQQILKRLAYDMKRQTMRVSPAVSSPGISFPFDSQPDPETKDTLSKQNVDVDGKADSQGMNALGISFLAVRSPGMKVFPAISSPGLQFPFDSQPDIKSRDAKCKQQIYEDRNTLKETNISECEFDLELSPINEIILAPLRETRNKTDISDVDTNLIPLDEENISVEDIVNENMIQHLGCSQISNDCAHPLISDVKYGDADNNLNEEVVQQNIIKTVEKTTPIRRNPNNPRKETCINMNITTASDRLQKKKDTGRSIVADGRKTKKPSKRMKNAFSKKRHKQKPSSAQKGQQKQLKPSPKSRKRISSSFQSCKTKLQVKEDVVKVIKKMHLEIEHLLRKRSAHSKGDSRKMGVQSESLPVLWTEE